MDREEKLAEAYLKWASSGEIRYEPDGNVPPDFSVNGTIGVEVRRLNENIQMPDGTLRGLEEDELPLMLGVRRVLSDLGPSDGNLSWFVSYKFGRPLRPIKSVLRELKQFLVDLPPSRKRTDATLESGLHVIVVAAAKAHPTKFLLGFTVDDDSGGMVLAEMKRNITLCMEEKARKVTPYLDQYSEWWLALVDYIGYGLDDFDQRQFDGQVQLGPPWSKVIVVNPLEPAKSHFLT